MRLETIRQEVARGGYVAAMMVTASLYGDRPVPLPLLRFGRSLARFENPLTPRRTVPVLDPGGIEHAGLRRVFEGESFDEWSLDDQAINLLRRRFLEIRPDSVLEFGSGVSTAVFSYLLRERFADDAVRLVSVEQSAEFVGRTEALLARAGTRGAVQFEFPGMTAQAFAGATVSSYDLDDALLARVFSAIQPSLIFIDGPFGAGPVRGPVLPRILPWLTRPATVILDDALRDNEMRILDSWSALPGVTVKGISLIRKGLAEIAVVPAGRN
jgi:predicted O-methyltransferase YrrM